MEHIHQLIISMATLSNMELRKLKSEVRGMSLDSDTRDMVIKLADVYITVGEDSDARAAAAVDILVKLAEGTSSSSVSSSSTYSSSASSSSDYTPSDSSEDSGGKWVGVTVASAAAFMAVSYFVGFWPMGG